ncbi:hypothetical protein [Clostridium manihotivorum]|nr:hypothetical protein [Clostridium manihotivorum]
MFAYCKNNPVNMSDDSGYRPNYICNDGGEIGVSGDSISSSVNNIFSISSTVKRLIPDRSQIISIGKSVAATGAEGGISLELSHIPDSVPVVTNRALRRAGTEFKVPLKGASILRGIGKIEKVGVVGVAFTSMSVWDNFHSGYKYSEAFGRSFIDVGVSVAVIGFGLFTPVGWAVGIGLGLGFGAEIAKNYIWKKE